MRLNRALSCLALFLVVLVSTASAQNGTISFSPTSVSGTPGAVLNITVNASLNAGVASNAFTFGLTLNSNGGAPAYTFNDFAFTKDPGLTANLTPSGNNNTFSCLVTTTLHTGQISFPLGTLQITIPTGARNGQSYTLHLTGTDSADSTQNPAVDHPLSAGGDVTITVTQTPANFVKGANTDNQAGTVVAHALANPLSVTVTDAGTNGVPALSVVFTATAGGGQFSNNTQTITVMTDSNGIASAPFTVGNTAGANSNSITATVTGQSGLGTLTFTEPSVAGPATQLTKSSGDAQTPTAGANTNALVALVRDQFNNPVSGFSLTFTVTAGGGNIGGNSSSMKTTDANGVASVVLSTGTFPGTNTVQVSGSGLTTISFNATTTAIPATAIAVVSGSGQSAAVTQAVTNPLVVKVTGAGNAVVAGAQVTFALANGSAPATINGPNPATADGTGQASVTITMGQVTGTVTVNATVSGVASPAVFTLTEQPGPAFTISKVGGDAQTGVVSTALANPLVVMVIDQYANVIANTGVTFSVAAGTTLSATSANTNASGQAQTSVTLATSTPGQLNVVASVTNNSAVNTTFTETINSGPPAKLTLNGGNGQTIQVAQNPSAIPGLSVLVQDSQNNPLQNITVTMSAASGVTFSGPATYQTNAQGIATAANIIPGTAVGTYMITASVTGLTSVNFSLTLTPGPANSLAIVSGNNQSILAGGALPNPLVVRIIDAFSNPINNAAVAFTVTAGGGTVTGGGTVANANTGSNGQAQTTLTTGSFPGVNTVHVTSGGLTAVDFNETGQSITPTGINVQSGSGQSAQVTQSVPNPLVVRVNGLANQSVAGGSVTFSLANGSAPATINGTNPATTDANGLASVTITMGQVSGTVTVNANVNGVAFPAVFTLTENPGPAFTISKFSGDAQTGVVSSALSSPLVVKVVDQFTNVVPNTGVTFSVAAGTTLSSTTATTTVNGQAQISVTNTPATPGPISIIAFVTANNAVTTTFNETINSGPPAKLTINGGNNQTIQVVQNPSAIPALSVLVQDAQNNPLQNITVTMSAASGVTFSGPATYQTNAQGIATAANIIPYTTAGTFMITASVTGLTSVNFSLTLTPGPANSLAIVSGNNQGALAGAALPNPLVVKVIDAFSNPINSAAVAFTVTGGGGTVTGGGTVANVNTGSNGQASTTLTTGSFPGVNTVHVTSGGLTAVDFNETGQSIPATAISVQSGSGQNAAVTQAVTNPLVVKVTGSGNAVVAGASVTFALANGSAPATINGTNPATTDANGLASVTITMGQTTGTVTVNAMVSGVASPAAFTLAETPGPAFGISKISGDAQTGVVSAALASPLVVKVIDQYANVVPNTGVTFSVAAGTTLSSTTATTGVNGQTQISVTNTPAVPGAISVVAYVTANNALTTTFNETINSGPPAKLSINGGNNQTIQVVQNPSAIPALSVLVQDAQNNPLQNITVNMSAASGVTFSGPATYQTNAQGIATAANIIPYTTAGTFMITASVTGLTSVNFSLTLTPGPASVLSIVSGNNQGGLAGTALANPLIVKVADAFTNPINNAAVAFNVTAGGGTVTGGGTVSNVNTGSNGQASTTLTTGSFPGVNTVHVTSGGLTAVDFTENGQSIPPTGIAVQSGSGQSAQVTQAVANALVVKVTGAGNAVVAGASVTFALANGSAPATINGPNPATTDANGLASVTITMGVYSGTVTVNAMVTGLVPAAFTLTENPGPVTAITKVSGDTQASVISAAFPAPLVVKTVDAYGNVVPSTGVTFSVTTGTGTIVLGTPTPSTGSNGQAQTTVTAPSTPQNLAITALVTSNNALSVVFSETVNSGPPAKLTIAGGNNQNATVGGAINGLTVLVQDAGNNNLQNIPVTFAVQPANAATFSVQATINTGANGQAINTVLLGNTAGAFTVTATVSGLSPVTFYLTANPAALSQILVSSGNNQAGFTSTALANPIVAKAADAFGNGISGVSVTFTIATGGGTVGGGANVSVVSGTGGLASANWTLGPAIGANTISASANGATPVTFTAQGGRTMTLSVTSLNFVATLPGGPAPQQFTITSNGGSIPWNASGFPNYLTVSPQSGNTPQTVTVSVNQALIGAGAYGTSIVVTGQGATNSPQSISVGVTLSSPGAIGLSQTTFTFSAQAGSAAPPAQQLLIFGPQSFPTMNMTLAATTSTGGGWLSVTPLTGVTPLTANIAVNPAGLSNGSYNGTITVSSLDASNSPQIVQVTLNVTTAGKIQLSQTSLSFTGKQGGANPDPQTFTASNTGGGNLTFSGTATTVTGGPWLSVANAGTTGANFTVSLNPQGLGQGVYTGSIAVAATGASNTPQAVDITLTVTAPDQTPVIAAGPASLLFMSAANSATIPATQTVTVQNTGGGGAIGFTVAVSTASGGNWLSVSTNSSVTPATITVTATPGTLAQGGYNGTITVTPLDSSGATNGAQTISAGLAVGAAPAVIPGGAVNAAIFNATLGSGSIVSLFGVNLATVTASASVVPLPTSLGGTMVLVNGVAAPLFYVSPLQINLQLPPGLSGNVTIVVISGTTSGVMTTVQVTPEAPGIFVASGTQGAVLDSDFTPNSPTAPAAVGSVIQIFATGLGATNPPLAAGQPGNSTPPFNVTVNPVTVTIGGQGAAVSFSAAAPGFAGLFQINATIPAGTPAGNNISLTLTVNGKTSNSVTICVKAADPEPGN